MLTLTREVPDVPTVDAVKRAANSQIATGWMREKCRNLLIKFSILGFLELNQ